MRLITTHRVVGIAAAMLLTFHADAQTETEEASEGPPPGWSMQFSVQEDFTLSSFAGGMVSLKWHPSSTSALRFGAGGLVAIDEADLKDINNPDTSPWTQTLDQRDEAQALQLELLYLRYVEPSSSISFYFGTGPQVNWAWSERTRTSRTERPTSPDFESETYTKSKGWGMGFSVVTGVEWFVADNVGVHAEYGAILNYGFEEVKATSESNGIVSSKSDSSSDDIDFAARPVAFGVSLYF